MRLKDYVYLVILAIVGLFGLLMILGAALQWSEGERGADTFALGLGLGLLPIAFSGWQVSSVFRRAKRRGLEQLERQVLRLASDSQGRLTPAQVAQATSLTLEESKAFLDRLGVDGHCRMDLEDDGTVSYLFGS